MALYVEIMGSFRPNLAEIFFAEYHFHFLKNVAEIFFDEKY